MYPWEYRDDAELWISLQELPDFPVSVGTLSIHIDQDIFRDRKKRIRQSRSSLAFPNSRLSLYIHISRFWLSSICGLRFFPLGQIQKEKGQISLNFKHGFPQLLGLPGSSILPLIQREPLPMTSLGTYWGPSGISTSLGPELLLWKALFAL